MTLKKGRLLNIRSGASRHKERQSLARRLRKYGFERLEVRVVFSADLPSIFDVNIGMGPQQPNSITATSIWQLASEPLARGVDQRVSHLRTSEFKAYTLEVDRLSQLLSAAPSDSTWLDPNQNTEITLADPNGKLQRFSVFQSSIMSPELQAQFPEIKTYAGQGIDDPTATVHFDVSPLGFHAQVLSQNGRWYIDPYFHLDTSVYASYYASSLTQSALPQSTIEDVVAREPISEITIGAFDAGINSLFRQASAMTVQTSASRQARSGTQLRTYRTAVAATGEYTAFFGGTVTNGQAAIVTAINRVSGIYENELSIRLQLVGNNSQLVFTNATTDPYTNDDADLLLDENQTTIDTVIGSSNYDLGHVFSTDGGGLAGLGVVGINGQKAQGETGLPSPVGDAFYVDYVAHEIGHQFGGDHTFNGDSGSCSGANRNGSTAYEPGSGSTIQAYAGICGNDNLQANSDAYFHSVSFDQILDHVDNAIPTVGTRTSTGNAVPTINAGLNFSIPTGTPFVLTAVGNDANGTASLTYNWEQRDLGPQADINAADNGTIPLFRSFSPTSNPSRTFPRLTDLVNNTTTIGEKMPTVARAMDFRATVRDNRPGGGGVNTDDMVVNVVNTGAPFRVTAPNTAVSWAGFSTQTVTWDVAGTNANGINTANVRILLSTDGGLTYPTIISPSEANDGSATITVPSIVTSTARLRVEAVGNIFFDISNANFSITAPTVVAFPQNFDSVTVPNLPTGWTQSTTSSNAWATVGSGSDTAPNSAFVTNPAVVSDSILSAPSFVVLPTTSTLSFRHSYDTDANLDGGVLEISVNGGAFADIVAAGGSFVSGGYVSPLNASGNPLTGRNAWHGSSGGFVTSIVNLPATALNQSAVLRWRFGSNASNGGVGWRIDTITFVDTLAPSTLSFTRKTPSTSATNSDTLVFLATFSEPVVGVDAADFAVTGTTGAISISQVTTSTYDVTISGGNLASLNGTVGLNFSTVPTITDLALIPLPSIEPSIDETYIVDNTTPNALSFTRKTPSTTPTNADTLVFLATFSEPVVGVDAADFAVSGTTGTINVSQVTTSTYDVTISGGNLASLNGTVGLNFSAAPTITDLALNPLPSTEPALDETFVVENTTPINFIDYLTIGSSYSQSFDTLATTGTSAVLPTGWLLSESGSNANATYTAGDGSGSAGDSFSYGSASSTERALGGLLSGSLTPRFGAAIRNSTGTALTSILIGYRGEQWRLGTAGRSDRLDFQYSLDATTLTIGTWTDVDALDFSSPTTTAPTGALNGNSNANQSNPSATIDSLNIPTGATIWIRLSDFNAPGADDGLAIDDFTFSATGATLTTPTITTTQLTKIYDGLAFTLAATADDGPGGSAPDTAGFSYTYYAGPGLTGGVIPAPENVGSYSVDVSYSGGANYSPVASTAFDFSITPFDLTGSITAADKVFDGNTSATILTRTLATVFAGDTVSYDGGTATFETSAVGTNIVVTATGLSLSGPDAGNYTVNTTATTTANITAPASVVNRRVFYNGGAGGATGFDANTDFFSTGGNPPVSAIDDKVALLPGQNSSFANYTNVIFGLNGIIVDIANPGGTITAADFAFEKGAAGAQTGFVAFTPTELSTTILPVVTQFVGGGINGSTRAKITFNNNSLRNTWVQVTVLANANTGLTTNDVFYFGNAVGEVNGSVTSNRYTVNPTDTGLVRANQDAFTPAVNNIYDFNKSGTVTPTDTGIVRSNQFGFGILRVITGAAARGIASLQAPTILAKSSPVSSPESLPIFGSLGNATIFQTAVTLPAAGSTDAAVKELYAQPLATVPMGSNQAVRSIDDIFAQLGNAV